MRGWLICLGIWWPYMGHGPGSDYDGLMRLLRPSSPPTPAGDYDGHDDYRSTNTLVAARPPAAAVLEAAVFDAWRQNELRQQQQLLLTSWRQQRQPLLLAGEHSLPALVTFPDSPARFVADSFASTAAVDAVLSAVQGAQWASGAAAFETTSVLSHLAQARAAGRPGAGQQLRALRERARQCVCEVLGVRGRLFHAHAALARTGPPPTPPEPEERQQQPSDEAAEALFDALRLKHEGVGLYRRGLYEQAATRYTEGLDRLARVAAVSSTCAAALGPTDHFRSCSTELLNNRALCHLGRQDHRQVVADTTGVLAIDSSNVKALLRRARAYESLEKYARAVDDYTAGAASAGGQSARATAISGAGRARRLLRQHEAIVAAEAAERRRAMAGAGPSNSLVEWELTIAGGGGRSVARLPATETALRPGDGTPPDQDGASSASASASASVSASASATHAGAQQFNGPHCDMASVVHYEYSAVLYLTGADSSGGDTRRWRGGELVFCDVADGVERLVVPRAGRLVGFTSGLENIHRIAAVERVGVSVTGKEDPGRVCLSMWFTSRREQREDPGDSGHKCSARRRGAGAAL
jgi:tetratricopeptide (TPR) repeat protein